MTSPGPRISKAYKKSAKKFNKNESEVEKSNDFQFDNFKVQLFLPNLDTKSATQKSKEILTT